jgi:hypothetical protein
LIPQFKQEGKIIFEFAVPGAKLEGTGLEKEQIVHTHVELLGLRVLDPDLGIENGLAPRWIGDVLELCDGECIVICGL